MNPTGPLWPSPANATVTKRQTVVYTVQNSTPSNVCGQWFSKVEDLNVYNTGREAILHVTGYVELGFTGYVRVTCDGAVITATVIRLGD